MMNKFNKDKVKITHPEKIIFPDIELTKVELVDYYQKISHFMLPHIKRRLLTLRRYPDGIDKPGFYQRHFDKSFPSGVFSFKVRGDKLPYLWIEDVVGLVALVQMSVVEIHPWGSTIDAIDNPDRLILDLDPGKNVTWNTIKKGALIVRKVLEKFNLKHFVKTTGGKGIHIVIPISKKISWDEVKIIARDISDIIGEQYPDIFTNEIKIKKRTNKIYLDYLRNTKAATAVAAYSTRAKEKCPISMPLTWVELSKTKGSDQFTIQNISKRMQKIKSDPWKKLK